MYATLLTLHIMGAVFTLIVGSGAVIAIIARRNEYFRSFALALTSLASFELASGTVLATISDTTALSLCSNIALYVVAVLSLQAALFFNMKNAPYPARAALTPLAACMALFLGALALGV